jgi:hypothetical protein
MGDAESTIAGVVEEARAVPAMDRANPGWVEAEDPQEQFTPANFLRKK